MKLIDWYLLGLACFCLGLAVNVMTHSYTECDGKLHSVLSHDNSERYWACVDGKIIYLTHER